MIVNGEYILLNLKVMDMDRFECLYDLDFPSFEDYNIYMNTHSFSINENCALEFSAYVEEGENIFSKYLDDTKPLSSSFQKQVLKFLNAVIEPEIFNDTEYDEVIQYESDGIYVCPTCFKPVEQCTCENLPDQLIRLDSVFYQALQNLLEKDYEVIRFNQSNPEQEIKDNIEIEFADEYDFDIKSLKNVDYEDGVLIFYVKGNTMEKRMKSKQNQLRQLLNFTSQL
ncbi:hypothetical protein [Floccifex sp.]|uniref:hypothetical protein n=1 Tax=Floccifex sp. TaxID=2815810 RepID=UPI003F03F47D|nr:hypothetical protein [Erysipelotrichaceae bacterium]